MKAQLTPVKANPDLIHRLPISRATANLVYPYDGALQAPRRRSRGDNWAIWAWLLILAASVLFCAYLGAG